MFIIPSEVENKQEISSSISRFIHTFKVGSPLKRRNCKKEKGIPFMKLFTYTLCNIFRNRSMHMQKKMGSLREDFSRNTYYRFLRSVRPNSFIPINFSLLASSKEESILGEVKSYDRCLSAGKRRTMAQRKGMNVMIQLIDEAMEAGHKAGYVLFDNWFSNPHQIVEPKDKGSDTIVVVKISSRISYEFNGERRSIKQVYNSCKKRRGRPRYLLSVPVRIGQDKEDGHSVDVGIVCVRSRINRKDRLAPACMDMSLREEDIIRIYGK